jgi:hypothetical protein
MIDLDSVARIADRQRLVTAQRDEAIRRARADGASLRQLAEAAGLSVEGVRRIASR